MIRIHIILHDLEDAAPDWIMAPATSVTLLNSFYTLYDFLPPSNPPPASSSLPAPHAQVLVNEGVEGRRTLTKRNLSLRSSLNSVARNGRPATLPANGLNHGIGNGTQSLGRSAGNSIRSASTMQRIDEKQPSFNDWSAVKLLEQYDLDYLEAISQPYAYVGDYMLEVSLGVSLTEEMAKYEAKIKVEEGPLSPASPGTPGEGMSAREFRRKSRRLGWLEKLRDGLQKGADIGWFVVVVGDEERAAPDMYKRGSVSIDSAASGDEPYLRSPPRSAGLKAFFNRRKKIPEE
jgi:hypothetical protein